MKIGELVKHRSKNDSVGIIVNIKSNDYSGLCYHIKWLCPSDWSSGWGKQRYAIYSVYGINSNGICQVIGVKNDR